MFLDEVHLQVEFFNATTVPQKVNIYELIAIRDCIDKSLVDPAFLANLMARQGWSAGANPAPLITGNPYMSQDFCKHWHVEKEYKMVLMPGARHIHDHFNKASWLANQAEVAIPSTQDGGQFPLQVVAHRTRALLVRLEGSVITDEDATTVSTSLGKLPWVTKKKFKFGWVLNNVPSTWAGSALNTIIAPTTITLGGTAPAPVQQT